MFLQEAEENFLKALELKPNFAEFYGNLGEKLIQCEHTTRLQVVPTFLQRQTSERNTHAARDQPEVGTNHSLIYNWKSRLFQSIQRKAPTNQFLLMFTGVLYHRWGKYDKAGIYYKRALMLEPRNENVLQNVQKLKRAMQKLSNGGSKKKIRK